MTHPQPRRVPMSPPHQVLLLALAVGIKFNVSNIILQRSQWWNNPSVSQSHPCLSISFCCLSTLFHQFSNLLWLAIIFLAWNRFFINNRWPSHNSVARSYAQLKYGTGHYWHREKNHDTQSWRKPSLPLLGQSGCDSIGLLPLFVTEWSSRSLRYKVESAH